MTITLRVASIAESHSNRLVASVFRARARENLSRISRKAVAVSDAGRHVLNLANVIAVASIPVTTRSACIKSMEVLFASARTSRHFLAGTLTMQRLRDRCQVFICMAFFLLFLLAT